jgi:hypothetical protein
MGSRNRKAGRNSEAGAAAMAEHRRCSAAEQEKEIIEVLDFIRFDETLQRVRSHPKNLLRLGNLRITQEREAKRNSGNNAAYSAATRRSMSRR